MIQVLLVHHFGLLRSGLAALLNDASDLEVRDVPWSNDPGRLRALRADVCVVDMDGPGAPDVAGMAELCRRMTSAKCGLLVLATPGRPGALRRAYDAQALGFVNKDATPQKLLEGIRQVAAGKRYVDESLAHDLLRSAEMPLTARELSVLSLAAKGATVSEIARRLHLSHGTIRNYMSAITRKTGARNRIDAIRISQGAGWV
ncbi:response regulator transcription factor [Streptomyces radiopugnans]|uniref:Two-component system, NarL family, response regulator DesR n=1 Tax=Streptomyces radiopugnans TaxID=403935 RepID=A0A1H8ZFZ1_9ACTN|nr:response regulator transcription factor [Streptomyces radiopugnans]SEP63296.1 two-component system, NarL family, response regulator DesR [Streptomyces radiopugnans]